MGRNIGFKLLFPIDMSIKKVYGNQNFPLHELPLHSETLSFILQVKKRERRKSQPKSCPW